MRIFYPKDAKTELTGYDCRGYNSISSPIQQKYCF